MQPDLVSLASTPASPAPSPPRAVPGFAFQPGAHGERRLSTGERRLDQLLGGGYLAGSATLLYGPPFCGKQQLQQLAILQAARAGVPATFLLHTIGASAMSERLRALDPAVRAAEAAGLLTYVDVHSSQLGEPADHPNAVYVRDPLDVGQVLKAAEPRGGRRAGLLAVESASALLVDLGPAKAFTVLRTVLARVLNHGGVGLVCLGAGCTRSPRCRWPSTCAPA